MTETLIDILIAFAVVVAIGLLMGILLALVSRFFGIEENPKRKQIRACLPGVNCGACGYKGCDDYAAALAESLRSGRGGNRKRAR